MTRRCYYTSVVCPTCGDVIRVTFCGVPRQGPTAEATRATEDVMLAAHRRFTGCAEQPDDGHPTARAQGDPGRPAPAG